jgi:hypothetical protein
MPGQATGADTMRDMPAQTVGSVPAIQASDAMQQLTLTPQMTDTDEPIQSHRVAPAKPTTARTRLRRTPEPGELLRIPGSGLGPCTFYREHIGPSGNVSWLVIDAACRQYHAVKPERVKIARPHKAR